MSNGRLVDGLPLAEVRNLKPNVLIVEGSYGTERHPHRKQQENYLVERLRAALANGGRAVFPSAADGDGTGAVDAGAQPSSIYRAANRCLGGSADGLRAAMPTLGCLSALPETVQNFAQHQPLFWDERVLPKVRRLSGTADEPLYPRGL